MTWTTAVDELRQTLSDGDTDKIRYRKRVLGNQDGTNLVFKCFEPRLVTDLVAAVPPEGVYVNGAAVTVDLSDAEVGEFTLDVAPVDGDVVEATYYYRWFIDDELNTFLSAASRWLGLGTDYTNVVADGLQPSALDFAASLAYKKLAIKWAEQISTTYRLEDAPESDPKTPANQYTALANQYLKSATTLRNDYYERQGQPLAPLWGIVRGRVKDPVPRQ